MRNFKASIFAVFTLLSFPIFGQTNSEVEMADVFRTNGKIYVVVIGMTIILTGVIIFLVRIERKLTNLEKREIQGKL